MFRIHWWRFNSPDPISGTCPHGDWDIDIYGEVSDKGLTTIRTPDNEYLSLPFSSYKAAKKFCEGLYELAQIGMGITYHKCYNCDADENQPCVTKKGRPKTTICGNRNFSMD